MAANKFATMLHRNTHKITVILVYAVLEWILISLLLLNSLFYYLITKFANYFGLKPPCLWCSRVDHILEPGKTRTSYTDLVCESHASEISKLGYCSNHRKLAEAQDMCEECSSSRPNSHGKTIDIERRIAFFSWVKEMGMISSYGEKKVENGEKDYRCSCCDVSLNSKFYSPYLLFQPPWSILDYTQKGNLITEAIGDDNDGGKYSDPCKSDCPIDCCDEEHEIRRNREEEEEEEDDGVDEEEHQITGYVDEGVQTEENAEEDYLRSPSSFQCAEMARDEDEKTGTVCIKQKEPVEEDDSNMSTEGMNAVLQDSDDTIIQVSCGEDASLEVIPLRWENSGDIDDLHLVEVELFNSMTAKNYIFRCREEDFGQHGHKEDITDSESKIKTQFQSIAEKRTVLGETEVVFSSYGSEENISSAKLGSMETVEDENSSVLHAEECKGVLVGELCEQVAVTQATPLLGNDVNEFEGAAVKESDDPPASEEAGFKMSDDGIKPEILVGTEMSDLPQGHELVSSLPCLQEDQSSKGYDDARNSNSNTFTEYSDQGSKQAEDATTEGRTISFNRTEQEINHHLSLCSEINEMDEEKAPETPTYVEGLNHPHKRLLVSEKRDSGTEESLDGSVISEFDGGEGVLTVERLKSALKAERKALSALYAELEEERSASAIAANQTMAMITRLQEEKAAMQMEALQYQRMMEEQSEYDQEALQLLNELMVKREKEKQDLEKELEIYRKKVIDYEAKERRMMRRRKDSIGKSRASSASFSNADDSDELSINLNHEVGDEVTFYNHEVEDDTTFYSHQDGGNHFTPDAVLSLEDTGLECSKHLSTLDESLADFEEERLSILDQLKALEEKLFTLTDDEEQVFEDIKLIEHFSEENDKELTENSNFGSQEANGIANGFSEDLSTKHCQEKRNMGAKAKMLLPLFDAIGMDNEDGVLSEEHGGPDAVFLQNSLVSKFMMENKKLAIEEVDHVYERLQALEADREFLKHCISSLKKGDKGMDLLQEILQHLRDLKSVELRVRNMDDGDLS